MPERAQNKKLLFKNKKIFCLFLVAAVLIIFSFCYRSPKRIRVSFLDVGQGDATLIQTPTGKNILLDGGPDNLILWRLGERLPFYARRLDYLIISHFHDDHIGGLIEILKRYRVQKIIFIPSVISSPTFMAFQAEVKKQKIPVINIEISGILSVDDDCSLFFMNPFSLEIKNNDNNSLVAKLDCRGQKFLFAGDNEAEAEAALVASGFDLRANIFKASHHGSKTSNTDDFLEAVSPQRIIISVGDNNRFGHPSQEVLKRLASKEIKVWRTDTQGTYDILAEIR